MHNKFKWAIYLTVLIVLLLIKLQQPLIEAWMRFQLRNQTIILTLSTTPHRINKIQPTVQTILAQNIQPSAIYLNVPYVFKRDNLSYQIPKWLKNETKITILRTDDYGPATKLLGTLARANLPTNAIIITLDDDIKYPKNTVLQLAYKALKNPDKSIAICGSDPEYGADGLISLDSKAGIKLHLVNNAHVAIAQGFAGVAYRRGFFNDDIFQIKYAPQECINSDDVYISFYLAKHGIVRQILKNKYINFSKINYKNNIGINVDALHLLEASTTRKHRVCIQYLKTKNPEVVF